MFGLAPTEYRLKHMFDTALLEMVANGQLQAIIDRHDPTHQLGRVTHGLVAPKSVPIQ